MEKKQKIIQRNEEAVQEDCGHNGVDCVGDVDDDDGEDDFNDADDDEDNIDNKLGCWVSLASLSVDWYWCLLRFLDKTLGK